IEDGYNRAVSDGFVDVLNSSFGGCETGDTAFDTSTNQIATQGASKGITFAASSGDSGSAECSGSTGVSSPASDPEFVAVGGTSLACPIFSALQTEINQSENSRNGFVNTRIYNVFKASAYADFHDVTSGSNGAFSAHSGFDNVTGIGSAKGEALAGAE